MMASNQYNSICFVVCYPILRFYVILNGDVLMTVMIMIRCVNEYDTIYDRWNGDMIQSNDGFALDQIMTNAAYAGADFSAFSESGDWCRVVAAHNSSPIQVDSKNCSKNCSIESIRITQRGDQAEKFNRRNVLHFFSGDSNENAFDWCNI